VQALTPVTLSLGASPTSTSAGQAVALTATTLPRVDAGTVTFDLVAGTATTRLGSAPVDAQGVATLTTSVLPAGTDQVKATYTPPATLPVTSASATTTVSVAKDIPTITVTGPRSLVAGSRATYGVAVTSGGQPVTSGTVELALGSSTTSAQLGPNGVAQLTIVVPGTPGTATLTASYGGSASVAPGSASLGVTIARVTPATGGSSASTTTTSSSSVSASTQPGPMGSQSSSSASAASASANSSIAVPSVATGEPFASGWWWVLSGATVVSGGIVLGGTLRRRSRHWGSALGNHR